MDNPTHTITFNTAEPTITFEEMRQFVLEMTRGPTLKEIRCDSWACAKVRHQLDAEQWANQAWFGMRRPVKATVNLYHAGTPVLIDDTFALGQWRAMDTEGDVMENGNLLHPSADACPTSTLDGSSGTVSSRRRSRV
jgi:hypothetical protein